MREIHSRMIDMINDNQFILMAVADALKWRRLKTDWDKDGPAWQSACALDHEHHPVSEFIGAIVDRMNVLCDPGMRPELGPDEEGLRAERQIARDLVVLAAAMGGLGERELEAVCNAVAHTWHETIHPIAREMLNDPALEHAG